MAMETQDIIKRSATNPITPAPRARDFKAEVAKLIDVSSCVGLQGLPGGLLRVERYPR
ncbi:Formate dehydrogenase-N subunit beta [Raoultella terrigena]|uniref:Formate dehydrogenase-N subunit beta n=1 Tax=Raoultella terrigena TaxID=577 RepID=A0A485BET3_RAOTE|nr:Formate dehydrogenase-N subunit beta [Raoultella terrigena]